MNNSRLKPRLSQRISFFGLLLSLLLGQTAYSQTAYTLDLEFWLQPRTGARLLQNPVLIELIKQWTETSRITIVYPGGEEGTLWAEELQDWLVALGGIPSSQIELLPGSERPDQLQLILQ